MRERPHQVQVRGGLRLHRLAHVAEHHHPARPAAPARRGPARPAPSRYAGPGRSSGAARPGRPADAAARAGTGGSARSRSAASSHCPSSASWASSSSLERHVGQRPPGRWAAAAGSVGLVAVLVGRLHRRRQPTAAICSSLSSWRTAGRRRPRGRWPSVAAARARPRPRRPSTPRAAAWPTADPPPHSGRPRPSGPAGGCRRTAHRAPGPRRACGSTSSVASPEHRVEDRVERGQLGLPPHQRDPGGPVEATWCRPGATPSARVKSSVPVSPTGTPCWRSRTASDTAKAARSTPRSRAAAAGHGQRASGVAQVVERRRRRCPVVRRLGDRAERAQHLVADQLGGAQHGQRRHPVDRLGHPRRLVQVEPADPADELGGRRDQRLVAPTAPSGAGSPPPAAGPGSRSSGRGSGAAARRAARGCGWRSARRPAAGPRRTCRSRGP